MEGIIALVGVLTITVGTIYLVKWYYKGQYKKSKHKFSDADVFMTMAKANHFLTPKQLAAVSPLNEKEAKARLMHLSLEGIVRRYQDGNGIHSVYHLMEELPENPVLPMSINGLSDQEIVDAVMKYSDDYQITIAELVIVFGLEIEAAQNVLKRLRKSGLVGRLWKGMSLIHVVKDPLRQVAPKVKIPVLSTTNIYKEKHKKELKEEVRLKIPDADVLNMAINHKGRLTATLLCLKLKISMEEAQIKLDELYEQGAFIMDVNEKDAIIEYHLRDKNLLS